MVIVFFEPVLSENDVSWSVLEDGTREMSSITYVETHLLVPSWMPFSVAAIERTGEHQPFEASHTINFSRCHLLLF